MGKASVCRDCNRLVAEKQDLRDKLRSAYRHRRTAGGWRTTGGTRLSSSTPTGLFMDDGFGNFITVALALLDENVESRSEGVVRLH